MNPTEGVGIAKSSDRATAKDSGQVEAPRYPETNAIIGAAMEVHRGLRQGFLEPVYQEALEREFVARRVSCVREEPVPVYYEGALWTPACRADFICHSPDIVEPKALG